jgi:hypothetical protein
MTSNSSAIASTDPGRHLFVFVGGLHRSGTSLLTRLLCTLPGTTGFRSTGVPEDEGQHLQSVFKPAKAFGGPGRFCFDESSRLDENGGMITEDNRARLWSEWGTHWDLQCPVLVEKSPPNLVRARFFQAMFQRTAFVFIVRHPVAVSLATQKWSKTSTSSLMDHWARAHRILDEDLPHLHRARVIRYEDLVSRPIRVIEQLAGFLDLDQATESDALPPIDASVNRHYFDLWESSGGIQSMSSTLSSWTLDNGDLLEKFGYRLEAPYVTDAGGFPARLPG